MTSEQVALIRELVRLEVESIISGAFFSDWTSKNRMDDIEKELTEEK